MRVLLDSSYHSDLFDRLLVAQTLVESIPTITGDVQFDAYQVQRLWP